MILCLVCFDFFAQADIFYFWLLFFKFCLKLLNYLGLILAIIKCRPLRKICYGVYPIVCIIQPSFCFCPYLVLLSFFFCLDDLVKVIKKCGLFCFHFD